MPKDERVQIVPYDSDWLRMFEAERKVLLNAIGTWLAAGAIEHIGSTAVPGLAAKPVIDIMAGVESLEASGDAVEVLEHCHYMYAPYRTEVNALVLQTLTGAQDAPSAPGSTRERTLDRAAGIPRLPANSPGCGPGIRRIETPTRLGAPLRPRRLYERQNPFHTVRAQAITSIEP